MAMNAQNQWKKVGLIGLCTAALLGAGSLQAEGWGKGPGPGPGPGHHGDCRGEHDMGGYHGHQGKGDGEHFERMAERLELTAEQQEKIQTIMQSSREEGKALHKAAREARKAVREALQQGESEKTVRKLAREAADKKVDLMLHGKQTRDAIDALLTDEQKAKKQAWHESMKERRQEHREMRMEKRTKPSGDDS